MATWRELIAEELGQQKEQWMNVVANTLTTEELDKEFSDGFGLSEGLPFTMWTHTRVYFPAVYDGSEWCASVPRSPTDEATPHVGGE